MNMGKYVSVAIDGPAGAGKSTMAKRVAKERHLSVEEAARSLRYEAFYKVARKLQADRIAVAHNENDQAETVLWNLTRGSGLMG